MKQTRFNLHQGKHGGRRPGSGRKRIHSKGVAHRSREKVTNKTPMHINFKYRTHIRNKQTLKLLQKAIVNARGHGLKILHYSLQSNHVHLIVEARDNSVLTKGMRSLCITLAKGLHKGRIQVERYHLHVLRTIRETRNAIHYVLFNQQKHERGTYSTVDQYSSVLLISEGLKLVKEFARHWGWTLNVKRVEDFWMDPGGSFLARKALSG